MSSSGTVSFSVSRDQIIQYAMYQCGALGVGELVSSQDNDYCAFMLNMLVKQWQGKQDFAPGLKMWSRKRADLFLSTTTGKYSLGPAGIGWTSSATFLTLTANANAGATTLTVSSIVGLSSTDNIGIVLSSGALFWTTINGAPSGSTVTITAALPTSASSSTPVYSYTLVNQARRPLQIVTAVLRDIQKNDTPLYFYNLQDYQALPSKANVLNASDPTSIYYEAQLTNGTLETDCASASDTTKYIHMVYLSPIEDFNAATDTPDYPQEWFLALVMGLAVEICPGFDMTITPELKLLRDESLAIAKEMTSENSTMFFQPKDDGYSVWGMF